MLAFKGPAQPSPTLGDALNAGYGYLEVRCLGCDTHQTVALDIVRRPKTTPIHELERYMRCKDCSEVRLAPATGRQDHTTSPSANASPNFDEVYRATCRSLLRAGRAPLVLRAAARSRQKPPCDPFARDALASTASLPYVRDDRDTSPLNGPGWGKLMSISEETK
jgi:hypothetical protein